MYSPTVYLSLVVLLHIPNVALAADVNGKVGERKLIPCKITGTYVLPEWLKDASIAIANEGGSLINPDYSARFSYASDQRTLIVDPVQLSDTGSYVCTHSGGTNSPQTTTVEITVLSPQIEQEGYCSTLIAVYIFYGLAVVILIVVIIICIYMLKTKHSNGTEKVVVILIFAVVLIIAVTAWFIPMQVTMEDCEKVTEEDHKIFIGLLVVEIISFLLGVIGIILLNKD